MQHPGPPLRYLTAALLVVMGGLLSAFAPAPAGSNIEWNARRRLTWDDFRGPVNGSSAMRAETYSRINYTYVCRYGELEALVTAEFVPEKSWVKSDPSDNLLRHEQGHFDITEIYARKLRRRFEEADNLCGRGQGPVDALAQSVFKDWNATQDLYDEETNHSKNIPAQKAWEQRIREELTELSDWASQ